MPGSGDLRDAFNTGAAGKATATEAFLAYTHKHDAEFIVLQFVGTWADGTSFRTQSSDLRKEADVFAAARALGASFTEQGKPQ